MIRCYLCQKRACPEDPGRCTGCGFMPCRDDLNACAPVTGCIVRPMADDTGHVSRRTAPAAWKNRAVPRAGRCGGRMRSILRCDMPFWRVGVTEPPYHGSSGRKYQPRPRPCAIWEVAAFPVPGQWPPGAQGARSLTISGANHMPEKNISRMPRPAVTPLPPHAN